MTERCHNEWCDSFLTPDRDEGEQCAECEANEKRDRDYWFAIFSREPKPYTREEIMDAYSDPTEYQKRERMLMEIEK